MRQPTRHHGAVDVADTLGFLLGRWSIQRSLVHRDGTVAAFVGTGIFTPRPDAGGSPRQRRARYEEAGDLRVGAYAGRATRQLDYAAGAGGGPVTVCFCDGRPFVDLDLSAGSWTAHHPCADDDYEITTRVLARDLVEERWRVRGPTKSYDATTTLTRLERRAGPEPGSGR